MKKNILSLAIIIAGIVLFTSCSDVLDLDPSDRFSPATVWSSTGTADSYVIGFYAIFRDYAEIYNSGSNTPWMSDAFSDILKSSSWDLYNHPYNKSLLQTSSFTSSNAGAFECWSEHYERIRRQNEFFRDVTTFGSQFDEQWITIRTAEVRFCRAYTYYLLCRVYGGVILRTEVDGTEENDRARSSEEECWDFIITELKAAAKDLPIDWDNSNHGRATKKAAYGLLSRVALFAENWGEAVQAAIDTKSTGGELEDVYANIFASSVKNKEILFAIDFNADYISHHYDAYVRPSGDTELGVQVYSAFVPTSELVDSYEMEDGSVFSWSVHGSDPYAGREPRFYASILYNEASWMNRKIETFVGGKDGFKAYENAGAAGTTVTGYYLRKYLIDGDLSWVNIGSSGQYWIQLRYAEVLLNKAEALAQQNWDANRVEALSALNEVRARVSLPARMTANKEEFMSYLRHERTVELAGEGLRYWDLRRWRLAVGVIDGQSVTGTKIIKQSDGTFTYEQVDADGGSKRIFYERFYKFAIPESERANNKLCTNNAGWN